MAANRGRFQEDDGDERDNRQRIPANPRNALTVEQWMDRNEDLFLRIEDITALSPGETRRIVFFDRNAADFYVAKNREGVAASPQDFFKHGYLADFTYRNGLSGSAVWNHGIGRQPFTFEVLVEESDMWYPLNEDGTSPLNGKHWSQFPPDTFVGWRGYCMWQEDLGNTPVKWVRKPRNNNNNNHNPNR